MSTIEERRRGYGVRDDAHETLPTNVFLQPIAAPSILGLMGFFGATLIVGAHLAGWYGTEETPLYLFPFAALFGGLAQFLAGMWAYRARDAVATLAHGTWGAFWLGFGILYWLVANGTLQMGQTLNEAVGWWFLALAAVTLTMALGATADNLGITLVLGTLTVASAFAAIGYIGDFDGWVTAAGWLFVFSAGFAWYTATAMILMATTGRTILPTGELRGEANVPGRKAVHTVGHEAAEPGIKQGQ